MAAHLMILVPAIFSCFFFSLASESQPNENHDLIIRELHDAKLGISRLETLLEESIQNLNAKTFYLMEREKVLQDMANEMTYLQSALFSLKNDSFRADERLKALEDEVRMLWAASRKSNFELHVLKSKVEETEDKLEALTLKVEKMAEVVTEQWIQIQHLEQAVQIAEMRALQARRERNMKCTFLKFITNLYESYLPEMIGALDFFSLSKGSNIKYYMSQALQRLRRLWAVMKQYHHELQGFIKKEMRRNELTAALVNDELVFFLASALITFPILSAWMVLSSQFS